MAVAETTMAPAPSATADIDRRLNTLISLVEQRTADLTTMTAAVNKAAAAAHKAATAADKAAATMAANLGDHGSLPTTYVPTPVPVLVETSSTPTLQPFVVPKPKPSTPTKCSMECRDAETYQVMPTLLRDLSSPAILSFRSESMYLPAPPPHPPEQPCSGQILVPKSLSWPSFQFVTSLRCNTELWLADTQPWGRNAFSPGYDEERHMVHMLDDAIQTQSSSRTKSNSDILDSPITMQAMQHYEEQCEQWDPGIHLVCGLLGNLIYFQGMQDIILSMQCTSWEFTVPPKWLSGQDGRIFVGGLLLHVFWTNLLDLVEKSFSFAGGIDGTTMGFYHGNTFQNSEATGGVLCNGVKRCREDDLLFIQVLLPVDFWCLGYVQAYLAKLWRCDYHRMMETKQT